MHIQESTWLILRPLIIQLASIFFLILRLFINLLLTLRLSKLRSENYFRAITILFVRLFCRAILSASLHLSIHILLNLGRSLFWYGPFTIYLFAIYYMWGQRKYIIQNSRVFKYQKSESSWSTYWHKINISICLLFSLSRIITGSMTSPKHSKYCLREPIKLDISPLFFNL